MSALGKKFSAALDAWKKVQELNLEDDDVFVAINQVDGLSEKLDATLTDLSKHFVVIVKQLQRSQRDRSPVRKAKPESRPYTVYYEIRNGDAWLQCNDVEVPSADPSVVKRELMKRYHRELDRIADRDGVAEIADTPLFAEAVTLRRAYTDEEIKLDIDWSEIN
jgi:hypothetical protein